MLRRILTAAAALGLVVAVAGGCSGEPEPVETTPGFAGEEEAFAAAEETYRAYVDALNAVDLSDPATFEPVFALTTGELNAADRENFSNWHADRVQLSGNAVVSAVRHVEGPGDANRRSGVIEACYDVTDVEVADEHGQSLVDPSRPDVQALRITTELSGAGDVLISAIDPAQELTCGE